MTGMPPTCSLVLQRGRPFSTTAMSALVPPTSSVMRLRSRRARDVGGADDAGGRAGEQGGHRLLARGGDRHDAAVRLRDVRRRRHPARGQRLLEALEVAPHLRLHVGVEHRQRRALVLARLGPDVGRDTDRQPGAPLLGHGFALPLVRGVAVGVQQGDDQPLDAPARPAAGRPRARLASSSGVSRLPSARRRSRTSATRARGHQRQRAGAVQIERVRQPEALELEDVAESLGDEQAQPGAGALDQRVHGDRGAVHDGRRSRARSTWCSAARRSRPSRTASANSCGVEGTFRPMSSPVRVSKRAKSVKVPPMSMPSQWRATPVHLPRRPEEVNRAAGPRRSRGWTNSMARDRVARIGYDLAPRSTP